MADSLGSAHLTGGAAATAGLASARSPLVKAAPDHRSQPARDFNPPPPPKKPRVEERSVKPKKVSRDAGVGGNGGGREKLQQPGKQRQSSGSSPGEWSGGGGHPPAPSTGGSQTPTNTHKVFRQSDFFLHKATSSLCRAKKSSREKQRERTEKVLRGGAEQEQQEEQEEEEEEKHKVMVTSGPATNDSDNNNNDTSKLSPLSAVRRENGEVTLPPKGRPPSCARSHRDAPRSRSCLTKLCSCVLLRVSGSSLLLHALGSTHSGFEHVAPESARLSAPAICPGFGPAPERSVK